MPYRPSIAGNTAGVVPMNRARVMNVNNTDDEDSGGTNPLHILGILAFSAGYLHIVVQT